MSVHVFADLPWLRSFYSLQWYTPGNTCPLIMLFSAQLHKRVRSKQCAQLYILSSFCHVILPPYKASTRTVVETQRPTRFIRTGIRTASCRLEAAFKGPLMGPCTCEEALPGKIECINARGKKPSDSLQQPHHEVTLMQEQDDDIKVYEANVTL